MMHTPAISGKGNFQQWVLVVALAFGFFSFSGCSGNTPHQPQVYTTELVITSSTAVKRAVPWYDTFRKLSAITIAAISPKLRIRYVLIIYHNRSKTRFDFTCRNRLAFRQTAQYLPIRNLPQSAEDDLPPLFRG